MKRFILTAVALIFVLTATCTVFAEPQASVTVEPNSDAAVTSEATGEVDYTAFIVMTCIIGAVIAIIIAAVTVSAVRNKNGVVAAALEAADKAKEDKRQ